MRARARFLAPLLIAFALATSALVVFAAPSSAPRARSRATASQPSSSRPRGDDRTVDRNEVQAFLTQARDEFLADNTNRGSSARRTPATTSAQEAGLDWIASFFSPRDRRRAAASARARGRRNLPPVVVDDVGIEFYLTARAFAHSNSVSDRNGRMSIARADEPNQFQWWYDFIFATQQQIIGCESSESCASVWHGFGEDGLVCCEIGAEFYGNPHYSCVEDADQCLELTTCVTHQECGVNQVCCATKARTDDKVCVKSFRDCEKYCNSDAECKNDKGEQCCYDGILGYSTCQKDVDVCPPSPPDCPTTGTPKCRSNSDQTCCGGVCCPADEDDNQWLCCVRCGEPACFRGSPEYQFQCPDPFCPPPPTCATQEELSPCTPTPDSVSRQEESVTAICCGGECCNISDDAPIGIGPSYCCFDFPGGPSGWSCQNTNTGCGRPLPGCPANAEYLDPCADDSIPQGIGVCCGPEVNGKLTCCTEGDVCCADLINGEIVGYSCKTTAQCNQGELCKFLGDCPNRQQYSTCGSCGQGNNDCALSCQAGVNAPDPNDPSWSCAATDGCDPIADYNNSPRQATCVCNNGQCGGATQCRGGGNCCACQARGRFGGIACANAPS